MVFKTKGKKLNAGRLNYKMDYALLNTLETHILINILYTLRRNMRRSNGIARILFRDEYRMIRDILRSRDAYDLAMNHTQLEECK